MSDLRTILAGNLRRLRKAKGLSQEDLAGLAEVDRTYISLVERKRNAISLDKLEQIAVALDIDAYLLIKPDRN